MYDKTTTAEMIAAEWSLIHPDLPPLLSSAIDLLTDVKRVDTTSRCSVEVEELKNAADVTEHIERMAEARSLTEHRNAVKSAFVEKLAQGVIDAANASVPEFIDSITPSFEKTVTRYTEAVALLPAEITAGTLVNGGPELVAAYQTARTAAAELATIDNWVVSLLQLPNIFYADPAQRIVAPESMGELIKIREAHRQAHTFDDAVRALNPVWVIAAQDGIPFAIQTPAEAEAREKDIQAGHVPPKIKRILPSDFD